MGSVGVHDSVSGSVGVHQMHKWLSGSPALGPIATRVMTSGEFVHLLVEKIDKMNRTKLPIRKQIGNVLQLSGSVEAAVAEIDKMNRTKLPIRKRIGNVPQLSGSVEAAVAEDHHLVLEGALQIDIVTMIIEETNSVTNGKIMKVQTVPRSNLATRLDQAHEPSALHPKRLFPVEEDLPLEGSKQQKPSVKRQKRLLAKKRDGKGFRKILACKCT
ncbi:hypothetical protein AgCh_008402 [Apium graveolens]